MISSSLFSPLSILTPPPAKSENISNKLNKITIDYLNQLPQNDYIIGPGDRLVINVGINAPGD